MIADRLVILPERQPEHVRLYKQELLEFSLLMYKQMLTGESVGPAMIRKRRRAKKGGRPLALKPSFGILQQQWREYIECWNGPQLNGQPACDKIFVYGDANQNAQDLCAKMARTFLHTCMRNKCPKPEVAKWTKLNPSIDWVMRSSSHRMLYHLVEAPGKHLKTDVTVKNQDGEYSKQMNWHAIASAKYQQGKRIAGEEPFLLRVRCLSIVLERTRLITGFFLKCSAEKIDPCANPVLNLMYGPTSIVTETAQYLSFLSTGNARRVRLLYGAFDCQDFGEYRVRCEKDAEFFLSVVRAVSSAVRRRDHQPFQQWPMKLFQLCDGRRTDARLILVFHGPWFQHVNS